MARTEPAQNDESNPLAHRRILITRAPHQASELADRLRALGATPILIPTIEIAPPSSFAALDAALALARHLRRGRLHQRQRRRRLPSARRNSLGITPAPRRIAVVGPATARAVEAIGLRADIIPPIFTAESLAETLLPKRPAGASCSCSPRHAPPTLRDRAQAAGAEVTVAAAYSNRIPEDVARRHHFALRRSRRTIPTRSPSPALPPPPTWSRCWRPPASPCLPQVVRASIGPITSRALRELGLPPHRRGRRIHDRRAGGRPRRSLPSQCDPVTKVVLTAGCYA